ncbi:MAG: hypothetical protein HY825_12340 [Acidobacteria bacterium]|nr:hypothetical protein [Acidobacteriota bacterium]
MRPWLAFAATGLLGLAAACAPTALRQSTTAGRPVGAGFRYSLYGPKQDPGPGYWARVGREMAARFPGAVPETIWIVGRLDGEGCRLSFPVEGGGPLIRGEAEDRNEAALDLFDAQGFRVWLQVEPAMASVEALIDLVLERYRHHPSVVGVGIDVEWYRSTTHPEGQAVTDAEARAWLAAIRAHRPAYRLFLKHWEPGKLPPGVRDGVLFIDDSQILPSLDAMVAEFAAWGRAFAPAPVAFQFGYVSDRPWWSRLDDPPRRIGEAILAAVPNAEGLYWVDFTVNEVFPPAGALAPPPVLGVKVYEHEGDPEQLVARWRELGINTAFVGAELARRDDFRAALARAGMPLFVIFPVLYAPAELDAEAGLYAITADGRPARDDWVQHACPSDEGLRRKRVEEARELVGRLRPAGLALDFVRHHVYWEMVRPDADPSALPDTCYCPRCLRRFAATTPGAAGLPLDDPIAAAAWIRARAPAEWARFKRETITSLAWEIIQAVRAVRPSIRIAVHVVPWRGDDFAGAIGRIAAQDRDALGGIADVLAPMTYSFMLYRPPEWIASVVEDVAAACRCPVLPSVQVAVRYRTGDTLGPEELEACLRAALRAPSAGAVLWKWEYLAAEPAKAEVVRRVFAGAAEARRAGPPRPLGPGGSTTEVKTP